MLPSVYERLYRNQNDFHEPEIFLTQDVERYYYKILKDLSIGRREACRIISEFLGEDLEVQYPKMISIEKMPIVKYKGKLYPILGGEDEESIIINKAFYVPDCFPMILDLDEDATYTLPIRYKLDEDYVYNTITHELLHHALRDRMINEFIVYKLIKK